MIDAAKTKKFSQGAQPQCSDAQVIRWNYAAPFLRFEAINNESVMASDRYEELIKPNRGELQRILHFKYYK
uniref:Uncharacterized protein n=1 Tax=Romanomermis culicivorax TaxID=13658 RepID=A0A915JCN8_ROMCU